MGTLLSGAQFQVLSTVDIWGQLILCCGGGRAVHPRASNSILGFY